MKKYLISIPGRATNYLELLSLTKKIWKRDCRIDTTRRPWGEDDGEWKLIVNGEPDAKFTMLCLHLPASIVKDSIGENKYDLYSK